MNKRQYKKIAALNSSRFKKFMYVQNCNEGDLIATCRGYNERIMAVGTEIHNTKSGSFVWDIELYFDSGNSCSLRNCCSLPESKEEILKYWRGWANRPDYAEEWLGGESLQILQAIRRGEDPFNEDGTLNKEYLAART